MTNPYINEKGFDQLGFIMDFEGGQIEDEQVIIDCLQVMIDTGIVWQLQGFYGRTASELISKGLCTPGEEASA